MKLFARVASLLILLGLALVPADAQRLEKKASGKGQVNPTTGCTTGAENNPDTNPCVNFVSTPGSDIAQWTNVTSATTEDGPYDLFMVPTTQDVTFQITLPTPTSTLAFGSFLCGDDPTMTVQLNGFCTNIDDSADPGTFLNPNPQAPDAKNQLTFGFTNPGGLPADWVFYFTAGDAAIVGGTVPEPGSLALLCCGLLATLAIGGKRQRA
jgi:hypothetical protein